MSPRGVSDQCLLQHNPSLCFPTGFGQRSCTSVHLGPEDAPAVFAICWGEDLSGQEG